MCKCLNPSSAWICGNKVAKDGILSPRLVFSPKEALEYYHGVYALMAKNEVSIPCGKCELCVARKRKDMATRLVHENSMHDTACFVTLTYNDAAIPVTNFAPDSVEMDDGKISEVTRLVEFGNGRAPIQTLFPRDVQNFIKRLRRHVEYHNPNAPKIRYFAVGEYGGKTQRPHYHLLIFGWKPNDCERLFKRRGHWIYKSDEISRHWIRCEYETLPSCRRRRVARYSLGFCSVSDVSPAVAKYAARYTVKKMKDNSDENINAARVPVFFLQSVRGGGIGSPWLEKHAQNCLTGLLHYKVGDRIVTTSIPQYYITRLRKIKTPLFLQIRDERISFINSHPSRAFSFDELCREAEYFRKQWYDERVSDCDLNCFNLSPARETVCSRASLSRTKKE